MLRRNGRKNRRTNGCISLEIMNCFPFLVRLATLKGTFFSVGPSICPLVGHSINPSIDVSVDPLIGRTAQVEKGQPTHWIMRDRRKCFQKQTHRLNLWQFLNWQSSFEIRSALLPIYSFIDNCQSKSAFSRQEGSSDARCSVLICFLALALLVMTSTVLKQLNFLFIVCRQGKVCVGRFKDVCAPR